MHLTGLSVLFINCIESPVYVSNTVAV